MLRLLLCLLLIFAPSLVAAGAWPRGAGHGFVASSLRLPDGSAGAARVSGSMHLDLGLGRRFGVTVELDTGRGTLDRAMAWVNLALLPPEGAWQLSTGLGGGIRGDARILAPRLMLGRGFRLFDRDGWAEAVLGTETDLSTGAHRGMLDLTLGLAPVPRVKSYVQLFARTDPRGNLPDLRIEASTALRLFARTWLDVGVSTGLRAGQDRRLKLGLWTSF